MSLRLSIFFVLVFPFLLKGQKENNIWCFGHYAGIDFNATPPAAYTNSIMYANEGCSSVCDTAGRLLFYTNGITVWDRNHQVMSNGTGLRGGKSSAQAVISVKQPQINRYYIFTTDDAGTYDYGNSGFCYSIIDMDANGGNGEVILKNKQLFKFVGEEVAAIKDESKVWIASRQLLSDSLFLYRLDVNGLTRIVHVMDHVTTKVLWGQMKFSPDGKTLAYIDADKKLIYLYDFDMQTAKLSNMRRIQSMSYPWSLEFSPSSAYLYVHSDNELYQFEMNKLDVDRDASDAVYKHDLTIGPIVMQLGPDNKIYFSNTGKSKLPVMNFPDNEGPGYDFTEEGIDLNGKTVWSGLPAIVQTLRLKTQLVVAVGCYRDSTRFSIKNSRADSIRWILGDGQSALSIKDNFNYIYKSIGIYRVMAICYSKNRTDTFYHDVKIRSLGRPIQLETDTSDCRSVVLSVVEQNGDTYRWNTGDTTPLIRVSSDGLYVLITRDSVCFDSSGIQVSIPVLSQVNLGPDTMLCFRQMLLKGQVPGRYLWSTGAQSASISVETPGVYWLKVSRYNCETEDSILILPCDDVRYAVPNAFSPNEDMINDVFYIQGENIRSIELTIYNRWGEKVFVSTDLSKGWDGKYQDSDCQQDIYCYVAVIKGFKGGDTVYVNGSLTLLR